MNETPSDHGPTRRVVEHHLAAYAQGVDAVASDYTERSVLLLPDHTLRGLGEIRGFLADFCSRVTPEFLSAFEVRTKTIIGSTAYLVWVAPPFVRMASCTLHIENGKILVHTWTTFPS